MTEATSTADPGYVEIPINELIPSKFNVRRKHSDEDVAEMAASIKDQGIINAPSAAQLGEQWEVIAGLLRVLGGRKAGLASIVCKNVSATSEAERIEMSLAENITRKDMTNLQLFKAFDRLFRAGRSLEQLAATFDMTEKEVRQKLAIGGLPKKIIALAEHDEIDDEALAALTTASRQQLAEYVKMTPRQRPMPWKLDEWIRGKKGWIPVSHAIFDAELYKGPISEDLFSCRDSGRYFTDADAFWKLQEAEITKQLDAHKAKGWAVVEIERWTAWQYDRKKKAAGGKFFYTIDRRNGSVSFYSGYAPKRGAGTTSTAGDKKAKSQPKPELSQNMQWVLRSHRHAAIQEALLEDPQVTLALTVCQVLSPEAGWRAETEHYNFIRSDKQRKSITSGAHYQDLQAAYKAMLAELGASSAKMYRWDRPNPGKLLITLLEYDVPSLHYFLSVAIAARMTVQCNPHQLILSGALGLEEVDAWRADDAFWSGLNSRDTLIAIVKEFGVKEADCKKLTIAGIRKLAKKMAPLDWRPKWLKFPGSYYGKKSMMFLLGRN